jgi:hypothetical protein
LAQEAESPPVITGAIAPGMVITEMMLKFPTVPFKKRDQFS